MRHQAAEGVREVGVNLLGTGQGEGAGWRVVGALLSELAGQVLVFDLDFLNGDDGAGGGAVGGIGGGLRSGGANDGKQLGHGNVWELGDGWQRRQLAAAAHRGSVVAVEVAV